MSVRLSDLPIFDQVLSNFGLPEREVQVWRAAARLLDVVLFRELKLVSLQHETRSAEHPEGLSRSTLSDALARLCARGYLLRQRAGAHAPWEYRIPLSRDPVESLPPTDEDVPHVNRRPRRHRAGMVSRGI